MMPTIEFDPGATTRQHPEEWAVRDYSGEVIARFMFREDAEMFESIIKQRPYRKLKRDLR